MAILRLFRVRNIVLVAFVALLSVAGYGFAAANTVGINGAGDGAGTVSGFNSSAITYALNSTNPANIDSVSFTLTPVAATGAPNSVKVKLVSGGSTWFNCSLSASTWTCPTSSTSAASVDELRIVAAQ